MFVVNVLKYSRALWMLGLGLLAGCGGGSGGPDAGGSTPMPAAVLKISSSGDLANASDSQLLVRFRQESKELIVQWTDAFAAETGYRVERRSSTGVWEDQESLAAASGTGTVLTWQRIIDQSATYRVVALVDGDVVPLTAEGASEIVVDLTAVAAMEVVLNQQEPVQGSVQLSVSGASSARSVKYLVDLNTLAVATERPSFFAFWNASTAPSGDHLVTAEVDQGPTMRVELRRVVTVQNPAVAVTLNVRDMAPVYQLSATATSDVGIDYIEFFLNDVSISRSPSPPSGNSWSYLLNVEGRPPGPATIKVVAQNNSGDQASATRQITIDNRPTLTIESPVDGQIISGSLEVRGTFSDDLPGAVLRVSLRDTEILQTSQSPFSFSHPLTGVPADQYMVLVRGTDSFGHTVYADRTVIVSASNTFNFQLQGSYPQDTVLLDTDNGSLLYQLPEPNKVVRLRRANGTEVELQDSATVSPNQQPGSHFGGGWQLANDRVTVASSPGKVYLYGPTGQRSEVPYTLTSGEFGSFLHSELHGPWLVWGQKRIYMRNLDTATDYGPVAGFLPRGQAFVQTPSQEKLFYIFESTQSGSLTMDLYSHTLAAQTSTPVTSGDGSFHYRPKTDGARVAWLASTSFNSPPMRLLTAPVDNLTAVSTLSSNVYSYSFDLADGLLAWVDTGFALKANDGTETSVISSQPSVRLYSTGAGHVIFGEGGKLYTWSKAQGRRLLLDALPRQVIQHGGTVFLTTGYNSVAIYKTTL